MFPAHFNPNNSLLILLQISLLIMCTPALTNRTPASRSSDFINHSYDYRPNWTPLSPITVVIFHRVLEDDCSGNGSAIAFHRFVSEREVLYKW